MLLLVLSRMQVFFQGLLLPPREWLIVDQGLAVRQPVVCHPLSIVSNLEYRFRGLVDRQHLVNLTICVRVRISNA